MKYRWLTAGALAAIVALAGCAPAQTGASPTEEASTEAEADVQAESQEAAPSMAAEPSDDSGNENSAPDDYDY